MHEVVIDNFVFFFAPADFSFFTALLGIVYVASPVTEIFGDPSVTVVRL